MNDFLTHFVCYKYGNNELLRFKNICIRFVRLRASTCGTVMVFRCCLLLLLLLVNGCCGTKCKKKKNQKHIEKISTTNKINTHLYSLLLLLLLLFYSSNSNNNRKKIFKCKLHIQNTHTLILFLIYCD